VFDSDLIGQAKSGARYPPPRIVEALASKHH
jgi:hypothetical protein